ncbi:alpha/beta fold hydrolase [Pedobacter sp. SYSU D00535]|uniref:alpha/beta fold hydrolase n=1 Tax=Pedobacter sp. SYSU D00535 TaxID=2810308 RepID=UPI001A958F69|nr:alpha/beta hydrolase [Pedobacter sp. SYSU D00535]
MNSTIVKNGLTIEYSLVGSGNPALVFFNGFRMPLDSWDPVVKQLSHSHTTLLFNRFGIGKTSRIDLPHTGSRVLSLVQDLLETLAIEPPYILVAHSLGGLFANLFARIHPTEVAGIVFVDSTHPEEKTAQTALKPPALITRAVEGLKRVEKLFDPYKYSEDEHYEDTIAEIDKSSPFPAIPITVVTGTKKLPFVPQRSFQIHLHYQEKLLELSPYSKQIRANNSGHFPQITEPNLVKVAIEEMLRRVNP